MTLGRWDFNRSRLSKSLLGDEPLTASEVITEVNTLTTMLLAEIDDVLFHIRPVSKEN